MAQSQTPAPLRAAPAGAPEAYHARQIMHAQKMVEEPVARGNEESEFSERS